MSTLHDSIRGVIMFSYVQKNLALHFKANWPVLKLIIDQNLCSDNAQKYCLYNLLNKKIISTALFFTSTAGLDRYINIYKIIFL